MSDSRREPRPAIVKDGVALIPLGVGAKDGYAVVDLDMAWVADKYKWTGHSRVAATHQLGPTTVAEAGYATFTYTG